MSTSTSALRIEQLKQELRKEEAALTAKKTLTSELNEARAAESGAERLARVCSLDIEKQTENLELLRSERDSTPYEFAELRAKKENKFKNAQDSLLRLQAETRTLAKKLHEKRLARMALEEKIAAHPIYQGIRKRQRELVEQAVALISSLFETTLNHWSRVLDLVERTEQAEIDLISQSMSELSVAGLPEISPVLRGFFQQAVPHRIVSAIADERTHAFQEIANIRARLLVRVR